MAKSLIRKGNPIKREKLEGLFISGLSGGNAFAHKDKPHGADVGMCPRKVTLHTAVDKKLSFPIDPSGSLYMAIGTAVHEVVSRAYERVGILLASEIRLEMDEIGPTHAKPLSAYIDLVIRDVDGNEIIGDVKTCGALPSKIKDWHRAQLIAYMVMSGIRVGFIQYVSRNVMNFRGELQHKILRLEPDDSEFLDVAELMSLSHYAIQRKRIAPIPNHIRDSRDCGFCPFSPHCWDGAKLDLTFKPPTREEQDRLFRDAAGLGAQLFGTMDDRRSQFLERVGSAAHKHSKPGVGGIST